ncbi:MAG: glycine--tRNA ligase [Nitrososphaerota archaeon]|nr:glycine--tRNA ligase [Candidatus Calditenuaceae archaeon]MDW8073227.1 glycine--tRNA ligase [Nitrososphaerota archaeon]
MPEQLAENVVQLALRRGFFNPTAEIYRGSAGFYDLGPLGALMKANLVNYWLETFVRQETSFDVYLIDGSLILPFEALKASGHVDKFSDPKAECSRCGRVHRLDQLIEEGLGVKVEGKSIEELQEIVRINDVRCPNCGGELTGFKEHHLMFKLAVGGGEETAFLRPETAQNIFLNFKRIAYAMRAKLPFAVAQVGRSFRNEISPRQSIIRLREFSQMEIELFFSPNRDYSIRDFDDVGDTIIKILTREEQRHGGEAIEIRAKDAVEEGIVPNRFLAYYLAKEVRFFQSLGIPPENMRFRHLLPEETPHYSGGNFDLEVKFSFGWKEIVGNAYRRDYDLTVHSKHSGEDLSIDDNGVKILPHVVEPSFGVERILYAILEHSYLEGMRDWPVLKLPRIVSPMKAAVLPLLDRENLTSKAWEIYTALRKGRRQLYVLFDNRGSIGRRYARADEAGVNLCITIDYQTLQDNTVTVRDRDTAEQVRARVEDLEELIFNDMYRGLEV